MNSFKDFFLAMLDNFKKACSLKKGAIEQFYQVANSIFCLKFASPFLAQLVSPALQHLRLAPCVPDATFYIWDSVSTKTVPLSPFWKAELIREKGEIPSLATDHFKATYDVFSGILNLINLETNEGIYWIRDANFLPSWEKGAPLRTLFHLYLTQYRYQLIHAAAVGNEKEAVLLVGKGGAGKSTTAYNCLKKGMNYLGDDYCISHLEPSPFVYSLYSSSKLTPQAHAHLFSSSFLNDQNEKVLNYLYSDFKNHLPLKMKIKAIFIPVITFCKETTLQKATATEGIKALAPSTLFQLAYTNSQTLNLLAKLIKKCPCYYLKLGSHLDSIPEVIGNFLSQKD